MRVPASGCALLPVRAAPALGSWKAPAGRCWELCWPEGRDVQGVCQGFQWAGCRGNPDVLPLDANILTVN